MTARRVPYEYVKRDGRRPSVLHSVKTGQGVLVTHCGRTFAPDGTNTAASDPERLYGRDYPWRECRSCARRVGHYDWQRH